MSNFFSNTTAKLDAVKTATKDFQEVVSGLQASIDGLGEEIEKAKGQTPIPQEGENFAAAFVRHTEYIETLESQKLTKEKALQATNRMADKAFPFTAKEIGNEFAQLTEEYKKDILPILQEAALEAKEKYERSLELIREAHREQVKVSLQAEQITRYTMGEIVQFPQLKILPDELFINKEQARSGRYA